MSNFFKKAGSGLKKAFSKDTGRQITGGFKKLESGIRTAEREVPKFIDTAVRKTSNTLDKVSDVMSKVGQAGQILAPALTAINPGLGASAMAMSSGASQMAGKIDEQNQSVKQLRDVTKPGQRTGGIQAQKPQQNLFDELPFY